MRRRRKNFYSHRVRLSGGYELSDFEFVAAERAGYILGFSDLLAIHPNIRAVIDTQKIEPHTSSYPRRRHAEFRAVPPGNAERTVFRHVLIREIFADFVAHAWVATQVVTEIRIRVGAKIDQRADDGRRDRRRVPTLRSEASLRKCRAVPDRFRRGLQRPSSS